jgi:hypothetical protein
VKRELNRVGFSQSINGLKSNYNLIKPLKISSEPNQTVLLQKQIQFNSLDALLMSVYECFLREKSEIGNKQLTAFVDDVCCEHESPSFYYAVTKAKRH